MAEEDRPRLIQSSVWVDSPPNSVPREPLNLTDALANSSEMLRERVKCLFVDGPAEEEIAPRRHWKESPGRNIRLQSLQKAEPPKTQPERDVPYYIPPYELPPDPVPPVYKAPDFLTRSYNPSEAILTIRSPSQIDDPDTLPRLSDAEKEKRKPRLHLLGLKRAGKSSILRTVFHEENAADTLYLPSTRETTKEPKESVINFDVWDHPSDLTTTVPESSPRTILSKPGALIFVIDSQDEYYPAIAHIVSTLSLFAKTAGPSPNAPSTPRIPSHINIEVFIHKVDGLSVDFRADIFRDIQQRIAEEMDDVGMEAIRLSISFHHTSIYDHSIFEAVSKVYQKLISPMHHATIEALVNSLCANCRIEKAYLFDTQYKFYIASDTHPGDLQSYETCSEYLDVVRDIGQLYGWREWNPEAEERYEEYHMESLIVMEKRGSRYMYMKGLNKFITLVCIMGEENPTDIQTYIEHNVTVFQGGLNTVLDRLKVLCA